MSNKQLAGELTITRVSNTDEIKIEFYDLASGVQFLVASLSAKDLGMAITGLGNVDCKFEFRPRFVGMQYQHKEELIPVPVGMRYGKITDSQAKELVRPHETDGWLARLSDLSNHHRIDRNGNCKVHFGRYIDPATGEPVSY